MTTIILPSSLNRDFRERWYGPLESIGYAVAYKEGDDKLMCLMSVRTGTGSSAAVQEQNQAALAKLSRLLRDPKYDLIPTHSHPIEGLSSTDESTLETLAKFGYHNSLVITPTRVRSYHTDKDGRRSENRVEVRDVNFSTYYEQIQEMVRILISQAH